MLGRLGGEEGFGLRLLAAGAVEEGVQAHGSVWIRVAMPQANKSALISIAI